MREALRRILILCRKETLAIFKDPRSRIILFVPVVLQSLLFGYAASYDLDHAPYALLDEDRSAASRELVERIEAGGVFLRVADLRTASEIAPVINRREALFVLHIGPQFERTLSGGAEAPVQVLLDGRNTNTAATAAGYLRAMVESFNARWREERGAVGPAVNVQTRAWYNENLETRWHMIPSLVAALSMLQTLMLTALSVAREREQGTFDQLLVTPLRPREIMVGKAVPPIVIGLVQSTIILLIALFWFDIPFAGSLGVLYFALALFTIATVGVGLAISALSANMQQAMLYSFVYLMPMMLLSGLASPIDNMPRLLQYVTYANPLRYAIEFVHRVYLEGAGLALIAGELWPLALISVLTLPAAAWLFRHRLV